MTCSGTALLYFYTGWLFSAYVMQSHTITVYALLPENMSLFSCSNRLPWVIHASKRHRRLSFFPSSHALFYLNFWSWLYSITMLLQRLIWPNQQLAISQSVHGIHCGSATFLHQASERPAQDFNRMCGIATTTTNQIKGSQRSPCIRAVLRAGRAGRPPRAPRTHIIRCMKNFVHSDTLRAHDVKM
jgi:hypothetical protein